MDRSPTRSELLAATCSELEGWYAHGGEVAVPHGVFRGRTLCRLDNPGARDPFWHVAQTVGFEWLPFGVDFVRHRWFFVQPALGVGRFEATVGPSRWRPTSTVRLTYDASRLPGWVRGVLYDEVKPLSSDRALGLGGINAGADRGDHFFFLLERVG